MERISRREFLKISGLATVGAALNACINPEIITQALQTEQTKQTEQPKVDPEDTCKVYEDSPDSLGQVVWTEDTYMKPFESPIGDLAEENVIVLCNAGKRN